VSSAPSGRARVLSATPRNIALLARCLRDGGLVAVPTETVYGLAACALQEPACRSIFAVKGRPLVDPLIVHVASMEMAEPLAVWNKTARTLAAAFWPGPLTLVLPSIDAVPGIVTAQRPTIAIRRPVHPAFQALIGRCAFPLAAPSANPFGYISPTTARHVLDSLGDRIPFILDGGPCALGLESTIVDVCVPENPMLLRPGAIPRQEIESCLKRPCPSSKPSDGSPPSAPGMMDRHYSPRVRLRLFPHGSAPAAARDPNDAVLLFSRPRDPITLSTPSMYWLTENGDLAEAGRSLFAILRKLDERDHAAVHIEEPPSDGLGEAILDRLRRAAAPEPGTV